MSDPKPPRAFGTGLIIGIASALVVGITTWILLPAAETAGNAVAAPQPSTSATSTETTPNEAGGCVYTPDDPAAKDVGQPENKKVPASGTVRVTLKTDQGDIPITLDRAKAPCTVASFLFLAGKKYFDATPCHRLTTVQTLKVLQCGDPSGTGTGGPGYTFEDELPRDLRPDAAGVAVYPAGTVAMANAGPNTNGSQFFLVYAATRIPPNYAVFGTYDAPAQAVLDQIAAGGVTESPNSMGPGDGPPRKPVTIQQVTAAN